MTSREWSWAGASDRGTSHRRLNSPKQDFASVVEYETTDGVVLVAVVSDGAGSASHGHIGSRLACHSAHSLIESFFNNGRSLVDLDETLAATWLSAIRDCLNAMARNIGVPRRELAATISISIASKEMFAAIIVGDSPCVFHDGERWVAPIWPMKGDYANQTYFVTQDPIPTWGFKRIEQPVNKFAVFSDGIEKLVLKEKGKEVFQPFFDGIINELVDAQMAGRNRYLSSGIRSFLASDRVNSLTDDDKTLVIAARWPKTQQSSLNALESSNSRHMSALENEAPSSLDP